MKTISERIKDLQAENATALDAAEAIITTAAGEARDLNETEQLAYDESAAKVEANNAQIEKLREAEKLLATRAVPAGTEPNATDALPDLGADQRGLDNGAGRVTGGEPPKLYKGAAFTRAAIALAVCRGVPMEAERYAKQRWKDHAILPHMIRAATDPISSDEATPAGGGSHLVTTRQAQEEFIELLRPLLIVERIPGLLRMQFGTDGMLEISRQTGGVVGGYVGEQGSMRVERLGFDKLQLVPSALAVIVPVTNKQLRKSNPSVEQLIRDDMLAGTARTMDTAFLSEAAAGAAPAGILNGVPQNAAGDLAAGANVGAVTTAAAGHIGRLRDADIPFTSPVWLWHGATKDYLRLQRTATDEVFAWKTEIEQGSFLGYSWIDSNNVGVAAGDRYLVLMDGSQIIWVEDLAPTIDASSEATIQSDDAPATPPDLTVPERLSAFQQDLTFFRIRMSHTWGRRHDEAVSWSKSAV